MVNSVLNEGARGLQSSLREINRAAQEIAGANVRSEDTNVLAQEPTTLPPVGEPEESSATSNSLVEPLVELRRQEQIFNANAKVVAVADEVIGSLIDVRS